MIPEETTIAIMGNQVRATHELRDIGAVQFHPDNPRVYPSIRDIKDFGDLTTEEQQHRIYDCLLKEPSVTRLIPEIERDGGLQEPIVVRHDTGQVVEGNSRLAAYRKLADITRDERWTQIPCLVVGKLTDDQQTRLWGQAHLQGKTDWAPYAKALFCFRKVEEEKQEISSLSKHSGISPAQIKKNIKVVKLMKENKDDEQSRYSYYEQSVTNRKISAEMDRNAELKAVVLKQIKRGSFTAQQLRDRLPTVIAKPRILRKYEKGEVSLDDAYDRAKTSDVQQRLKNIRVRLDDIKKNDIKQLESAELKAIQLEMRRIGRELKRVEDMVGAKLSATSP